MGAEHRQHRTELEPAHVQFPVGGVVHPVRIIAAPEPLFPPRHEKRADIQRPPADAAAGRLDALRHLGPEHVPAGGHVARPQNGTQRGGIQAAAAGQQHGPLVGIIPQPVRAKPAQVLGAVVVHALRVHAQRGRFRQKPHALVLVPLLRAAPVRIGDRLAAVAPQRVRAAVHPEAPALPPVQVPGCRRKGVVDAAAGQEQARGLEFVAVAPLPRVRPDRHHEMDVHAVQRVGERADVRKALGVRRLVAPAALAPAEPVQHDAIQRQAAPAKFPGHGQQLVRRFVAFLRLDIPERPLGQQRGFPRQRGQLHQHPGAIAAADDHVGDLLRGVQFKRKAVAIAAEPHGAARFDEQAPARVREQERYGDLHVVLVEALLGIRIIEYARFVLAQPGQHVPLRAGKAQRRPPAVAQAAFSAVVEHHHFAVGRLLDGAFPLRRIQPVHRPRRALKARLAQVFPAAVREGDGFESRRVPGAQLHPGDAFGQFRSHHATPPPRQPLMAPAVMPATMYFCPIR